MFAKFDETPLMILQDIKETKCIPLRITKGNNSNSSGPYPLIFISSIGHILMNVFEKFDEIPSMILQDIKETKCYGHKNVSDKKNVSDTRSDNVKTVHPPTNTVCGGV